MRESIETPSGVVVIPDAIVAADPGGFVTVPHFNRRKAALGEMVKVATRPLVEAYVAATPAQRDQMLADADAKLAKDAEALTTADAARLKKREDAEEAEIAALEREQAKAKVKGTPAPSSASATPASTAS